VLQLREKRGGGVGLNAERGVTMRINYFVQVSGTDQGISGIPRVVKNLARALGSIKGVELVPVSWSARLKTLFHTEQKILDNLALHGGPKLTASSDAGKPVAIQAGEWLLVAEAPHLGSHDRDYPSLLIDQLIGFARHAGLLVGIVLHDIMPLTHSADSGGRLAFADMASVADRGDEGERQRLRFAIYAHAVALADVVLPVSRTSGELLGDWLVRNGHSPETLPAIDPILLPEEVASAARIVPHRFRKESTGPKRFLSVGTVGVHKNQLAAMAAFQRLIERRPDLDVRLDVVGLVTSEIAVAASQLAKRSKGRIVLHGLLADDKLETIRGSAYASVFVSLAEGYGLPVAESLWRGKPCLCSNDGSIAEIAVGGGCLPVNPRSIDEIERGFERLATDPALYELLSQQIAARKLRSWAQYAGQIVDRLTAYSEGRLDPQIKPRRLPRSAAEEEGAFVSPVLVLSAADLSLPGKFGPHEGNPIRHAGVIRYDGAKHGAVKENVLFFGPYVWLPAGHYAFRLDGEITGEISLNLTADEGRHRIASVHLSRFDEPIVVELAQPVNGFEIVGHRTPTLERLVLRGAVIEYRSPTLPPPALPEPVSDLAAVSDPTPAAETPSPAPATALYGWDDNGQPLSFPCTIPASGMRVHEAYGAEPASRIRSDAAIAFRSKEHDDVAETNLFFGPYLHLEPGRYAFRLGGQLQGALRIRMTQNFASGTLLDTVVKSFRPPIRLTLTHAVEKFEILGDRTSDTRTLTLRAITIVREGDVGEDAPVDAPVAVEEEKAIAAPAGVGDPK